MAFLALVALASALRAAPAAPVRRDHEVKAAALYNIVAFTDWPATAFKNAESPLTIGVLGQGPVAALLGVLVENETWHGRPVVLQRFAGPSDIGECQVLFIAVSEHAGWLAIRAQLARKPILTVCDAPNFVRRGGIVQFTIERNRLRLTINLRAARAAGLTISSNVLRLAEIVDTAAE